MRLKLTSAVLQHWRCQLVECVGALISWCRRATDCWSIELATPSSGRRFSNEKTKKKRETRRGEGVIYILIAADGVSSPSTGNERCCMSNPTHPETQP